MPISPQMVPEAVAVSRVTAVFPADSILPVMAMAPRTPTMVGPGAPAPTEITPDGAAAGLPALAPPAAPPATAPPATAPPAIGGGIAPNFPARAPPATPRAPSCRAAAAVNCAAPCPGAKYRLLQSSPIHPAPHMHMPFMHSPRLLQFFGQVLIWVRHCNPVHPCIHVQVLVIGSHAPLGPHGGLHMPEARAHVGPSKPMEQ